MSIRLSVFQDASFNFQNLQHSTIGLSPQSVGHIQKVELVNAEEVLPDFRQSFLTDFDPDKIGPNPAIPEYTFWRVLKHLASAPELVKSMFVVKDEERRGKYSLYLNNGGPTPKEVEIDTRIPIIKQLAGKPLQAFTSVNSADLWPLFIEKAIIKEFGTGISFGENKTFQQYSAVGIHCLQKFDAIQDKGFARQETFDLQFSKKLIYAVPKDGNQGIPGDAYPLIKRARTNKGEYIFKVGINQPNTRSLTQTLVPNNQAFTELMRKDVGYVANNPSYQYVTQKELEAQFSHLVVFDYSKVMPQLTHTLVCPAREPRYISLKNNNPNQDIHFYFKEDKNGEGFSPNRMDSSSPGQASTPRGDGKVRILVGQLTSDNKMVFEKFFLGKTHLDAFSIQGGNHFIVWYSEVPVSAKINIYHLGEVKINEHRDSTQCQNIETMIWRDYFTRAKASAKEDPIFGGDVRIRTITYNLKLQEWGYTIGAFETAEPARVAFGIEGGVQGDEYIHDSDRKLLV